MVSGKHKFNAIQCQVTKCEASGVAANLPGSPPLGSPSSSTTSRVNIPRIKPRPKR